MDIQYHPTNREALTDLHLRAPVIIIPRRVGWGDFNALSMVFEGLQFRIELVDPTDNA